MLPAPLSPSKRPLHGRLCIVKGCGIRRTFVQYHHDVGTEGLLYLYGAFRSQGMLRAVYVGLEENPFLGYLSQVSKAEYLESTAVCKYRPIPCHEFMKTAKLANDLMSRPEHEVVGVSKDYFSPKVLNLVWRHGLDCRNSTYRHEDRGIYHTMPGIKPPKPSIGRCIFL